MACREGWPNDPLPREEGATSGLKTFLGMYRQVDAMGSLTAAELRPHPEPGGHHAARLWMLEGLKLYGACTASKRRGGMERRD